MSTLESLPDDLLLIIFSLCDVDTLLKVSLTCKRFYVCIDRDCFWREKLHQLYGDYDLPAKVRPKTGYKSACLRHCAVFGADTNLHSWADCPRCQDLFCTVSCIQERDEVIIFDFGSKTTWFKYASDSTGQLSMHPTVAPVEEGNTNPLSQSSDEGRDIYQCCPVCSKMYQNRAANSLPEAKTLVIPKGVRSHHGTKRLSAAFSRLAWRHFPSCFDSSELESEEEAMAETLSRSLSSRSGADQLSPAEDSAVEKEEDASSNSSSSSSSDEESASQSSDCEDLEADTYKFLIMHMLRRNPCFQAKGIPFVLCEPTNCSENMKIQLLQFLFTEIKVPGVCYIPKPVAVALYSGLDTCLVIDSGANNTLVSAVVDQNLRSHCVHRRAVGGTLLTARLLECIRLKGVDIEVDEANVDSSQVKRECFLAYNVEMENRRTKSPKNIHVKGYRSGQLEYQPVALGPELYLAAEDMYLHMGLAAGVSELVRSLDTATARKVLGNVVLTGGNCRLAGLALRLTRDLKEMLPEFSSHIRVVDPRLMTGRTDAVIGASYIRKWYDACWVSRQDYVYHGALGCMERARAKQVHCV